MADSWPEITQCLTESRRELVLKGNDLRERVVKADGELPLQLYDLNLLNFLEINSLEVKILNDRVKDLKNLTQLFLRQNNLTSIPESICTIKPLKVLDVSENCLDELPSNIGELINLHTLNISSNELTSLPSSSTNLASLAVLHMTKNKFTKFPSVLCEGPVCTRLAEFYTSHNQIEDVTDSIEKITLLKVFDISDNNIKELTQAIGRCLKLKQINFKGNPIKDKRLKKLVETNNSHKSTLDYIRTKGRKVAVSGHAKETDKGHGKGSRKKLKDQRVQAEATESSKDLVKYFIEVLRIDDGNDQSQPFRIIVHDDVKEVRPYVVGCIIKDVDLDTGDKFKSFITLQTRLHDDICQKRTIATIATHDVRQIPDAIVHYDAQDPRLFAIQPLGKKGNVSAISLYQKLCKEADEQRKEKKRNQVSGIHKYLNLLKDKEMFACLRRNSDDCVISLPPLTNCEATKISRESSDVFVEVTGTKSLNSCKAVLDELLKKMVELGFYSRPPKKADFYDDSSEDDESATEDKKSLFVKQVRVETEEGDVKVIYPSRNDLAFDSKEIKVIRSW